MDLRQLEYVMAVAEHGNFSRAAESIDLTQPALSRSIQKLEEELGLSLFERNRQRVVPTEAGRVLIDAGRALLLQRDDLARELALLRGVHVGEIVIGAGPYPADLIVGPVAATLLRARPDLRLRVVVDHARNLLQLLRGRKLDLFIAELSELGEAGELAVRPMESHQGYFVVRGGHPLAHEARLGIKDVLAYPLVMSGVVPRRVQAPLLDARAGAAGAPRAFPAVQCDSPALMRTLVANSDCVGVFMLSMVDSELEQGTLAVLPCMEPWVCTNYGIVRLTARTPSPVAQRFIDLAEQANTKVTALERVLHERYLGNVMATPVKTRRGTTGSEVRASAADVPRRTKPADRKGRRP